MGAGQHEALYIEVVSPVHRLAPELKVVAAVGIVCAAAIADPRSWPTLGLIALVLVALGAWARLPIGQVLPRLALVLPFITFALFIPFLAGGETVDLGPVSVSRDGLWGMWTIVSRALIGITVSTLLASTTRINEVLVGLGRLGVPDVFTAIAGFMFRYLELAVNEISRMRRAMTARGYEPRWLWQAKPLAAASGTLFIRSYERGERVHAAMMSRGYTGTMPALDRPRAEPRQWLVLSVGLAILWALAIVGVGAVGSLR